MDIFKIISSFIKIRLHNIGSALFKTATAYSVGAFATIQLSSIVVDNVSVDNILGMSSESLMQILFILLIAGFPFSLIATFIFRKKNIIGNELKDYESLKQLVSNKKPKIGIMPFENLNDDKESAFLVDGIVEDLITKLSMVKEISVATRKTFLVSGIKITLARYLKMNGVLIMLYLEALDHQITD